MKAIILLSILALALTFTSEALAVCSLESGGVNTATLSWDNTDAVDPVNILRSTTSGGPYSVVATVPAGILTYVDPVAAIGATYYYTVRNNSAAAGVGPNSNEVCKTFFAIPPAPTNLSAQ
jgi:fibronectin type 3 domain-containing protein